VKCFTESEFLVVGIDLDQKTRAPVALLADEEVNYAGAAFIALSAEERERFFDEVERLACERSPIPGFRTKRTTWCRPELRVRVKHLSGSVTLRHATLRALV
jgi:ATP-dependent DNA ligase